MVIANSNLLPDFAPGSGVVTAGRDVVAVATLAAVEEAAVDGAAKPVGRKVTSDAILVPNPVGLHARPAAVLSNLAAQYESEISLKRGEDQANAKSVMAIMGHGGPVRRQGAGHRVRNRTPTRRWPNSPRRSPSDSARKASSRSPRRAPNRRPRSPPPRRSPRRRAAVPMTRSAAGGRRLAWAGCRHRAAGTARGLRGHGGFQRPAPGAPSAQRRHRPVDGPARGAGGPAETTRPTPTRRRSSPRTGRSCATRT